MKLLRTARIGLIALLLVLCMVFASCDTLFETYITTPETATNATSVPFGTTTTPYEETTPPEIPETTPEVTTPEVTAPEITTPETTTPEATTPEATTPDGSGTQKPTPSDSFDYSLVPTYSGKKFAEINNNVPYFNEDDYTTKSYETYADLDSLNRCGVAMACLGKDLMPTDDRESISSVTPSGWVQASYDVVDGKYLYNRSHLIGWQLAGENANEKNLITGTRSFNQLGMLTFENMVADYIKETGNHVLYRVTPVFVGNDLVARGVLIEAWSVEDDGDGVCFNVFVYNVQPGIEIDYATGKSCLEGEDPTAPKPGDGEKMDYVANKSSKKFHKPNCSSVSKMSEGNKLYITATREEMIADGYSPCGNCNP